MGSSGDPAARGPGDVLVLGSAQFSDRSWVNCQHVAARLAERERVLFVDSIGLRAPQARGSDLRRIVRRVRDAAGGLRKLGPKLFVMSPLALPGSPGLLRGQVRLALRSLGMRPDAILAYLPSWAPVVEAFPEARRVYHCVDDYSANPGVDREQVRALETRLLRSVDVVIAASPPLARRLARNHARVHYLGNVADVERFAAATGGPPPAELARLPRPWILYAGNLAAYKIDLALLERLARARPAWSWILLGPAGRGDPSTDLSELRARPGVFLAGERGREEVPAWVAASDVCLLPLRKSGSTEASFPLKTWEYLAAGRPVVATPIPALEEAAAAGLLRTASGDTEWIEALEACLHEGPGASERRRREASLHGWGERMEEIRRLLFQEWPV